VRDSDVEFGNPIVFSQSHSAWKLLAGLRPISLAGVEFEYIEFGRPSTGYFLNGGENVQAGVQQRAPALFGVVYAPIPVPFIDVFGKAGAARLQRTFSGSSSVCSILPIVPCTSSFETDRTAALFAYGAGAQVKFSSLAIRAEYERVNQSGGNPDLLSLGITWSL